MHPDIEVINPGSSDKKEIWHPQYGHQYLLSSRNTPKVGVYFGKTKDHHIFYEKREVPEIIGSGMKPALMKHTVWRHDSDALRVMYVAIDGYKVPAIEVKPQTFVKKDAELEYILQQLEKMKNKD